MTTAAVRGPANFTPAAFSLFTFFFCFAVFFLFVYVFFFSFSFSVAVRVLSAVCVCVSVFVGMSSGGIALVALSVFLSPRREEAGETDTVQEIGQHASLCCCPWAGE